MFVSQCQTDKLATLIEVDSILPYLPALSELRKMIIVQVVVVQQRARVKIGALKSMERILSSLISVKNVG